MNKKVKLLIVTQKVDENDDVLGFMHGWIKEFARQCEKVTVICLYKGQYNLPENVKVLSLGKEDGVSRLKYFVRFYNYIWRERKNYDNVFVHMNQVYVILGWKIWRLLGKKIGLWYAHGYVPFSLRLAEKPLHKIFTSTVSGFRLNSKKLHIVGQGIDTEIFAPINVKIENDRLRIISIGRISPVKNYETLIKAVEVLIKRGMKLEVNIIGGVGLPEQEQYLDVLKKMTKSKELESVIHFKGAVPNKDIITVLQKSDLFVNTSLTGSLDKAMLEAMSIGLPTLTCNEAMLEVLGDYKRKLMYNKKDFEALAEKIVYIIGLNAKEKEKMSTDLRDIVVKDHSLPRFVKMILDNY
ncbi:MAG TPA: glycosyltransferase [Candidatus Yonathbacteria bacterium]|nr:glycosyltransferase [Candidatus Yonathbacteria bacterium]